MHRRFWGLSTLFSMVLLVPLLSAQPPFGPGGPGMMKQERKIVATYDKDGDGRLNVEERKAARAGLKKDGGGRGGFGRPGGGGFGRQNPPKAGPKMSPAEVKDASTAPLYDDATVRTLFLDFESADWEAEMADFYKTDVEMPATLTVDGKKYPNVGVHFRGMSSFGMVPAGVKRSLNLSMDFVDPKQDLYGYRTLNLLNCHGDASLLSSVLYSHIARQYIPAPKVNLVKVVINGEYWGVYSNVQQFNKDFLKENFKTTKGSRWKVPGSPNGQGGLEYLGENVAPYKQRYQIKSKDDEKAWTALINLCKVLNETPADKLEAALAPILDLDGLLWFLALDCGLMNSDGYWTRASDYSIYLDEKGKFHIIPHDMNEAFRPAVGGFGGPGGGPGGRPGGFRPPPPGEVIPAPLQAMLRLTEKQKEELATLQKEVDEQLVKLLNEDQRTQFKAMREAPPMGPGGFGPPGGGGATAGGMSLDPLVGLQDARKPLRSKILAVPALRERYLKNMKTLAEKPLDWKVLGPLVAQYRKLVEKDVALETRSESTPDAFLRATADRVEAVATPPMGGGFGRPGGGGVPLRAFAEQRSKYLLENPEIKKLSQ